MASKVFIIPAMLLVLAGLLSATVCYQESANTSNQSGTDTCAGLSYSGSYDTSFWGSIDNPANSFDGGWGTNTSNFPVNTQKFLVIEYVNPPAAYGNQTWTLNYTLNDTTILQNLTFNKTICNKSLTSYFLMVDVFPNETAGYFSLSCEADTGNWVNLYSLGNPSNITGFSFTEEAVIWNVGDYISPVIQTPDNLSYTGSSVQFNQRCDGFVGAYLMNLSVYDGNITTYVLNADPIANHTTSNTTVNLNPGTYTETLRCVNGTLDNTTTTIFTLHAPSPPTPVVGQNPLVILILTIVGLLAILLAITIIAAVNFSPEAIVQMIVAVVIIVAVFLPILKSLI